MKLTKIPTIIQSSQFRANFANSLKKADIQPLVISSDRGSKSYVILNSDFYNKLVQEYEDRQDAFLLKNALKEENENNTKWTSWEDFKKE